MTTTSGSVPRTAPFSARLRELSWTDHGRAETAAVLRDLFSGDLDRKQYARLVGQLFLVYDALEEVGDGLRDDPIAGGFVAHALARRDRIAADLAVLEGAVRVEPPAALPATAAYCDRIRAVADWPGGFVAHHYTRYMGDLSGGQAMRAAAARAYGLTAESGLAFYDFPGISDHAAFKNEYRQRLDDAPWDAEEQDRIGAEVLAAYAHNVAVLDELGSSNA